MNEAGTVHILHNEDEYEAALVQVAKFFDEEPELGTPQADEFDALTLVITDYEDKHFSIPQAHPVEVLKFMMNQNGRTQADLANLLGSRSRASEILNGKRDLTLDQIRRLAKHWHIPAAALIGEFEDA